MPAISFRRKAQLPVLIAAVPLLASLGGCHEHFYGPPHHVVHGRPVNVFAHPVGYAYPAIADRTKSAGYHALPLPSQRPLGAAPTAPTTPQKSSRKQSSPAPTMATAPGKPTVEVVPRQDEADGRATTQTRRQ